MKHIYAIALVFAGIVVGAQTAAPSWSGLETQQLLANCQLHNSDSVVCAATDGVSFSYQGAALVKISSVPPPAPTFTATATSLPAGSSPTVSIAGSAFTFGIPKGDQGIPGPVQSFNTNSCKTINGSSSGWIETGCVQSTP